jgi:hypothetical protein
MAIATARYIHSRSSFDGVFFLNLAKLADGRRGSIASLCSMELGVERTDDWEVLFHNLRYISLMTSFCSYLLLFLIAIVVVTFDWLIIVMLIIY